MKIAEFIKKEYHGPKGMVVFISAIGGMSFGMLLYVVNRAAEIAADTARETDFFLLPVFLALGLITALSKRYIQNKSLAMTEDAVHRLRVRLIDKLRHAELHFIENTGMGHIYARIAQDTNAISQTAPSVISSVDAFFSGLAVFIYIGFISATGFWLIFLSLTGMHAIFFWSYFKIKENLQAARKKQADFFDALNDTLLGFKEIKINSRKSRALFADIERLSVEKQQIKTEAELGYDKILALSFVLHQTVLGIILFVVPMFSSIQGDRITKTIVAALFILGMVAWIFRGFYSIVKINVVLENLEGFEAVLDRATAPSGEKTGIPETFREIRLCSLVFQYSDKEGLPLFKAGPVDLNIRQGEVLFIVGGNGSGKSTLLKLLTGLYYPMAGGYILRDNRRVIPETYQSYRELFSVIFTDFHLFRKLYGLESVDSSRVADLLEAMSLHTKTGYAGGRFTDIDLSTGQKKRLAYITAILEDRPIYVFDEWAADQDPVFRRLFYEKFLDDLRAMKKTVIAVTHDDRYFDKADRVIRMEEGRAEQKIL